jgi:hypothetical protein
MPAVLGALMANGLITVLKFIAAVITGSSGMTAESIALSGGHDESGFPAAWPAFLQATGFGETPVRLRQRAFLPTCFYFIVPRSSFIV